MSAATDTAHTHGTEADTSDSPPECPFCTYMRSGGCGVQFDSFMDCGQKAEKGDVEYEECYALFEAMRDCMKQNEAVYADMIQDLERAPDRRGAEASSQETPEAASAPVSSTGAQEEPVSATASSSHDSASNSSSSSSSSSSSTHQEHVPGMGSTMPATA